MAISQNFPTVRPTLNLNFARSKTLDPRITFTRSSTATYVDEDGLIKTAAANEPRFDHDPATGKSLGLLIEEGKTNINSSQGSLTGITNPAGSTGGQYFMNWSDAVYTVRRQRPTFSYTLSAGTYVLSFYVKPVGQLANITYTVGSQMGVVSNVNSIGLQFIALSGTISSQYGGDLAYPTVIQQLNNNWYRVSLTTTFTGSGTGFFYWYPSGAEPITVDTNTGFYVWGVQLEAGSFATSYIPTSGSQVTRETDNATITGTNFSNWYSTSEGTAFIDMISTGINLSLPYQSYFNFNSDGSNRWGVSHQNGTRGLYASNAILPYVGTGAFDVSNPLQTFTPNTRYKIAMQQPNGINVNSCLNGGSITTLTTSRNPSVTQLFLGTLISDNGFLNGTISKFCYYPERLTNEQLQNLTK